MENLESKKLVLLGIRRRGEKKFKVRMDSSLKAQRDARESAEVSPDASADLDATNEALSSQ